MKWTVIKSWAKDKGYILSREKTGDLNNPYDYEWYLKADSSVEGTSNSLSKVATDIFNHLTKSKKNIFYVKEKHLNKSIYKETNKKNLIIFMGAGSISKIASNFLKINE